MRKTLLSSCVVLLLPCSSWAVLRVVTTTQDLAALARAVGGDRTEVSAIAGGDEDPHFVQAKPSYILKLKRADLFIQVGLELELGWAPTLLNSARNAKILPGSAGFMEASAGCDILDLPGGQVTRAEGDVHPFGNPHYWLSPENGGVIARNIAAKLRALDPEHAAAYDGNLAAFLSRLDAARKRWSAEAARLKGVEVVTYHRSWPNFAKSFGLEIVDYVEPKPGIPPSPKHTIELIRKIRSRKIRLIIMEPYFDLSAPRHIAKESGAAVLVLPPSVGGAKGIEDYIGLFDYDLARLSEALK
ncbi:MAG: metal ABC transporter substrate-binding protein [Elusimicrobiota bacterium]|jgi:ABC-type Zn uptake system ZnuABC Zn-binding protein ZnuA